MEGVTGDLKLGKLTVRTPVRITIGISPALNQSLAEYAACCASTYGGDEPVTKLIAAMLGAFLESDKAFIRWRREARSRHEESTRIVGARVHQRRVNSRAWLGCRGARSIASASAGRRRSRRKQDPARRNSRDISQNHRQIRASALARRRPLEDRVSDKADFRKAQSH